MPRRNFNENPPDENNSETQQPEAKEQEIATLVTEEVAKESNHESPPSTASTIVLPAVIAQSMEEKLQNLYPTDFYKKSGIGHCSACGEQKRTKGDGTVFCPSQKTLTECPMLKAAALKNAIQ
jgi:hypothetical protein